MDRDRTITIILSVIWGIGLAVLFRKTCVNDQCIVVKAPTEFQSGNNIIYRDGKCYQLRPYVYPCK